MLNVVSVPLGGFAAASQCSEVLTTRVAAEFWAFADTAAGYATDQAVAAFCEQIEADEMTTFLLGTGAGLLAGMAMDRLRPGFVSTMENIDYEYEESFQRVMGEMKGEFEHFLHDNRGFLNLEAFGRRRNTTIIDYSYKFDRELANFNDGYEVRTIVDKDLILVQYSSDAPDASLCYWTTVDEANGITTLNDYMDKLALSKDWGNRNTVKVARIPAGTEVKYAVGTAREQLLIADPRPGGGVQYLFNQFDTNWITEIRSLTN